MQQDLFVVLSKAKSRKELREVELDARGVREKYMSELEDADVRELAIHRRLSRVNYSRRCAEASALKAYQRRGFSLAPGMQICYVVRNAAKWEVDTEIDVSGFDAGYYGNCLTRHVSR
jgi:DNA polymerase, archaea type